MVVKLRRNFGQTAALAAGFDNAEGEYVIAMDGDLQHDPEEIPRFLEKLDDGYDIVADGARSASTTSSAAHSLALRQLADGQIVGVDIHDFGTTFKAYRREVSRIFPSMAKCTASFPRWRRWYGASICEIPIRNVNRERGKSPLRHRPYLARLF